MTDDEPGRSQVVRFRLTPKQAIARIRASAQKTENIILSTHATKRMVERGIYDADIYQILRTGVLAGGITPGKNPGRMEMQSGQEIEG